MPTVRLTEEDEGKRVVASNGNELGVLADVRDGTPYVAPNPGVFERARAEFGWGEIDADAYPLETADVADVTDDEIHLQ